MNFRLFHQLVRWAVIGLASLLLTFHTPLNADEADLKKEIESLRKRLLDLEKRLELQENKTPAQPAQPIPPAQRPLTAEEAIDAEFMDPSQDDRKPSWFERTSLGGYGEMHLTLGDTEEIDFHRFVLFVDHEFTDKIRLVSELELEHSIAGEGKNGEIELEQAYIEADFGRGFQGKGGLFLIPVGILNETHEPTTFFGTERNPIEKEILPSTWWEGGLAVNQLIDGGLRWDLAFHSGLAVPTTGANAFRIRSGRQKVSQADASEWASTLRLLYTGIPGIALGGSAQYQDDITPTTSEQNDAWLTEAHVDLKKAGFGLRALTGYWNIDGPTAKLMDADEQWGFYVEPSYTFTFANGHRLGVFARYNKFDAAIGDSTQIDGGVNYWPIERVVFKVDYSNVEAPSGGTEDLYNVGIGYQF